MRQCILVMAIGLSIPLFAMQSDEEISTMQVESLKRKRVDELDKLDRSVKRKLLKPDRSEIEKVCLEKLQNDPCSAYEGELFQILRYLFRNRDNESA